MNFLIFAEIFASLAQLVEQLIRNEQVVGSSPIGGSKDCGSSSVVEHQLPKLRVGGSIPLSRSNKKDCAGSLFCKTFAYHRVSYLLYNEH